MAVVRGLVPSRGAQQRVLAHWLAWGLAWLAALALTACASGAPTSRGKVEGARFAPHELLQSEGNRITQDAMQANLSSLWLLADKLYRRNPAEWRKHAASREAALMALEQTVFSGQPWRPLGDHRDVAALSLALSPDFFGDRVGAFIAACADTIVTAHGGRRDFYYLDGIDPQYVFNAARNMEVALWMLNSRRDARGGRLLLANQIDGVGRNLSFEREFGKIIGRLDLLAVFMTERHRRAGISYLQTLVATPLLVFLPVR